MCALARSSLSLLAPSLSRSLALSFALSLALTLSRALSLLSLAPRALSFCHSLVLWCGVSCRDKLAKAEGGQGALALRAAVARHDDIVSIKKSEGIDEDTGM